MRNILTWLLAAAIGFAAAFFIPRCTGVNWGSQATPNDTILRVDTFIKHDTIKIAAKIPKPKIIIDSFWRTQPVDTQSILADYHNKIAYDDTVVHDSSLLVIMHDTVTRNRITYRAPFVVKSYPIITNTTTITVHDDSANEGLYAGGYVGKDAEIVVGLDLSYLKNGNSFGVMVGTNGYYAKYTRQINWKKVSSFK